MTPRSFGGQRRSGPDRAISSACVTIFRRAVDTTASGRPPAADPARRAEIGDRATCRHNAATDHDKPIRVPPHGISTTWAPFSVPFPIARQRGKRARGAGIPSPEDRPPSSSYARRPSRRRAGRSATERSRRADRPRALASMSAMIRRRRRIAIFSTRAIFATEAPIVSRSRMRSLRSAVARRAALRRARSGAGGGSAARGRLGLLGHGRGSRAGGSI